MEIKDSSGNRNDGLVVAVLDFPRGGTLGLDGQSMVVQTDDFLGVKELPRDAFHLVTCKNGNAVAATTKPSSTNHTIDTAVTVGFLVYGSSSSDHHGHLVRRYDPQTEEVSSMERSPIDARTEQNLVHHMAEGNLPNTRVLRYDQVVSGGNNHNNHYAPTGWAPQTTVWEEQTRYLRSSIALLSKLRGFGPGDKIVPGCYDPGDETESTTTPAEQQPHQTNDGKSLSYPPIPVVDPRVSRTRHKHTGTNRFLSGLSPRERTELFLAAAEAGGDNDAGRFVWLDRVLEDHYEGSWEALLGDLQLSYVLFLYLGCFASLGHWKDLLALLALAVGGPRNHAHASLYQGLLRLLPYQLSALSDPEFLETEDEGGGNFLVPSLVRLKAYYESSERKGRPTEMVPDENDDDTENDDEEGLLSSFQHVLAAKFPQTFSSGSSVTVTRIQSHSEDRDGCHPGGVTAGPATDAEAANGEAPLWSDDDEDGPVVVSSEEIEASLARTNAAAVDVDPEPNPWKDAYPMLAAAKLPTEDVLMTCARALDDKNDVSLVREAAAYLQEVEEKRECHW